MKIVRNQFPQRAAFCHIPRTGGISLHNFFENFFLEEQCFRFGEISDFKKLEPDHDQSWRADWKAITAHMPIWQMQQSFDLSGAVKFSVVRNPIDREISAYNHIRRSDHSDHIELGLSSFDDYIDFISKNENYRNMQCKYLQLNEGEMRSPAETIVRAVSARYNIFAFDKLYVLQAYLKCIFDVRYSFEQLNGRTSVDKITKNQTIRLEKLLAKDFELYDLVSAAGDAIFSDWSLEWVD